MTATVTTLPTVHVPMPDPAPEKAYRLSSKTQKGVYPRLAIRTDHGYGPVCRHSLAADPHSGAEERARALAAYLQAEHPDATVDVILVTPMGA